MDHDSEYDEAGDSDDALGPDSDLTEEQSEIISENGDNKAVLAQNVSMLSFFCCPALLPLNLSLTVLGQRRRLEENDSVGTDPFSTTTLFTFEGRIHCDDFSFFRSFFLSFA